MPVVAASGAAELAAGAPKSQHRRQQGQRCAEKAKAYGTASQFEAECTTKGAEAAASGCCQAGVVG